MDTVALAIIYTNLAAATAAGLVNLWVAKDMPAGFRYMRAVIGGLALFYAAGYVALVTNMVTITVWSEFFRGVSPFAWLLVWALPALYERNIYRAVQDAATPRPDK